MRLGLGLGVNRGGAAVASGEPIVGGTITPTSVNIQTTVAFSQQFTATGGTGPYTWSVSGTSPTDITMTGDTWAGTTTDVEGTAYSVVVKATDANGDYILQAISGTVGAAYEMPNGTILSSFATPDTNTTGLASYGGNLISTNAGDDLIYIHDGISSTILSSFAAPGTVPTGLTVAGGNLISADQASGLIYIHDGISSTILSSFAAPSTAPWGVAFDGTNLISADYSTGTIYIHDGISSTILSSFAAPGTSPVGISFDGTNLISADYSTGTIYIHDGISSTILSSFAGPASGTAGVVRIGVDLISSDFTANMIYVHDKGPVAIAGGTITPSMVSIHTTVAFSQQFTATGGTGPYTWSDSGTLPTGITLTGDTLSGTTTDVETTAYSFTIKATDSNGDYIDQAISGTVQAAAVSYLHWRMNVSAVTSGSYIAVQELELRTSYGGAQAAVGGIATTSDTVFGGAANAFDGNVSTLWTANAPPQWLAYEFSAEVAIVEIEITSRAGVTNQTPRAFTIEGSADGVAWDVVSTHSIAEMVSDTTLALTVQ